MSNSNDFWNKLEQDLGSRKSFPARRTPRRTSTSDTSLGDELLALLGQTQKSQTPVPKKAADNLAVNETTIEDYLDEISIASMQKTRAPLQSGTLYLKQPDFYLAQGTEAKRYADAVEKITGTRPIGNKFYIDPFGSSTGIAGLENYLVIVSLKQFDKPMPKEYPFKRNFIKRLQRTANSFIEQITFAEALYGEIKTTVSNLGLQEILVNINEYKGNMFNMTLELDTVNSTRKKISEVRQAEKAFEKDPQLVLKPGYYEDKAGIAKSVISLHGPLDKISLPSFPVTVVEDFVKITRNEESIYAFHGKDNFLFIYFDDTGKVKEHKEGKVKVVNGYDTASLIKTLYTNELVTFSKKRAFNILDKLKQESIGEKADIKDIIDNVQENGTLPKEIKEQYSLMEELAKDKNYFLTLPVETQVDMMVPRRIDSVFYEILNRGTQPRVMRRYSNQDKFIEHYKSLSSPKKVEFLKDVFSNIRYEDQVNYIVNSWLNDNAKDELLKADIKIVGVDGNGR